LIWCLLGATGAALGSFVAASAYRLRSDTALRGSRSRCEGCARVLRWWENVPLVSYPALRGRCATCGASIRIADYLIEVGFGLAVPVLFYYLGPGLAAARALVALPILAIGAAVDLHERLLPLPVTRAFLLAGLLLADPQGPPMLFVHLAAALGLTLVLVGVERHAWRLAGGALAMLAMVGTPTFLAHCAVAVAASGTLLVVDWIYTRLRRIETAIGGGDIRLAAGIAAFTGPAGVIPAIFLAAALGSVAGIAEIAAGRGTLRSPIPFGPFLALGTLAVLIAGPELMGLLPGLP